MTVGQIIKARRKQLGINADTLAEAIGISRATMYRYENGAIEKVPGDVLSLIAKALNTTPHQLMGWADAPDVPTPVPLPAKLGEIVEQLNDNGIYEMIDYGEFLLEKPDCRLAPGERRSFYPTSGPKVVPDNITFIRHYLTPAAAGYASPIEGEDYELIPVTEEVPQRADFAITISGDSMEPYIHDGQTVYVERDASLSPFDVGIFFVDGDVYCKQYCTDSFGTLYLLSANPKREDANHTIGRSSDSTVVCFGKVILPRRLPQPVYR